MIKIGIAGIGNGLENIPLFVKKGIIAGEVEFVRQVYMKSNDKAKEIGVLAKKEGFDLSVHAPYFVNLNSHEKVKVDASIKRILDSCERGHHMGAKNIVFHSGYYGKDSKEDTFETIKGRLLKIQDKIKDQKWDVTLCPETMGKINVFGSFDEIMGLVKEVKCGFCMDFAHMKARHLGSVNFEEYVKKIKKFKHVHCHYSGIEWTDKGEKKHIPVDMKEAKELVGLLKKHKVNCTIICESPETFDDTIKLNKLI